ncbi:MAG: GNAT family N-acetyltransferase [Dictyoglomaceae bacterium]
MEICNPSYADLQELLKLVNDTFRKDFYPSMEIEFPLLFSKDNLENLLIIKENGKIVSHFGSLPQELIILGNFIPVGCIGSVCTHPNYRGKGYASILLKEIERRLKHKKIPLMLISGTRALYTRGGSKKVGRLFVYELESIPMREDVDVKEEIDWDNLKDIYQTERTRYFRSQIFWSTIIKSFNTLAKLQERNFKLAHRLKIYTVLKNNISLGYFLTSIEDNEEITIEEYAGSRYFIFNALALLSQDKKIILPIPSWDKELLIFLKDYTPSEVREMPWHHTWKIIDEDCLFSSIIKYIKERVDKFDYEKVEDGVNIKIGRDMYNIKKEDLPEFVLGGLERKWEGDWKKVFPLPLPLPGFNYI